MFDRFTHAARLVMGHSRQEAQRLDHQYLGTEHLLLALLVERETLAAEVLRDLGATREKVQAQIETIVRPGAVVVGTSSSALPFTPRGKRALELALEEANGLGDAEVRPEHLLLGVVGVDEGVAFQALQSLGLSPGRVRDEVLSRLPGGSRREESGAPAPPTNALTRRAERTLALAREEAARLGHAQVETEHLFLAILQQADAAPAQVLEGRGLKLASLRAEVLGLLLGGA